MNTDVEASGLVMLGVCSVKGPSCTAPVTAAPITAVWEMPSRKQINVCRMCFKKQMVEGEWKDDMVRLVGEVERLRAEVAAHVARAAIVDDFNRSVASIVKQQPYETAELYDHPSQALKAMCDLIEDLQAENRKGPAKKP